MDGWINGWMDGWMDERDSKINYLSAESFCCFLQKDKCLRTMMASIKMFMKCTMGDENILILMS